LRRLGLSETDIMELCGWETRAMFERYCIKDEAGLAARLAKALSERGQRSRGGEGAREGPSVSPW